MRADCINELAYVLLLKSQECDLTRCAKCTTCHALNLDRCESATVVAVDEMSRVVSTETT